MMVVGHSSHVVMIGLPSHAYAAPAASKAISSMLNPTRPYVSCFIIILMGTAHVPIVKCSRDVVFCVATC